MRVIIHFIADQLSIPRSRRSVLNFKFSALTHLRSMTYLMSIKQNMCEEKIYLSV